ncbi:amino acid-binding ACT domain protein [Corynebacterium poyangense]|uniref:Amino acid-binding ACT domain protein n=1 Tax=Corynebacterium poyangense TaxID=2684405 RepID=A0A7H0SS87_9CORY|nr:amino acid-binding ACT domain protein [Corynebacterium poyangense]QNQ91412.1 amino acid-binding ACT domain protein [Corynebacterium poyangense]
MSFLIRVQLPDSPGALGQLADAFGLVDGNIQSVDVVEQDPQGIVVDDIVITLPKDSMADVLITAAQTVEGVEVDSIRPFTGTVDRRGQIRMLHDMTAHRRNLSAAMAELVRVLPKSMTASWAIVLCSDIPITRVAASQAAPEDDGSTPTHINVTEARVLQPEHEDWIPESWSLLDSALAAAPLQGTGMVLVIGRTGGPDFLSSEVDHLGHLGTIIGAILSS